MPQSHRRHQEGLSTSGILDGMSTPKEKPLLIGPPIEGLNYYDTKANVGVNETPYCFNARISRGYIAPRPGLTLNHTFTGETVMYIREHTTRAGQTYLLVITDKKIYKSTDFTNYTAITWASGDFTGTTSDTWWGLTIADVDWFVFCNGVDPVFYIDEDMDAVSTLYSNPAKYGCLFADRLMIAYTTESSTDYGYRIRYSAVANYDDFTGVGSGYKDFVEDPYEITGLSVMSDTLIVYKTYSIFHVTRTGKTSAPFDYKLKVPGIGCYVPGSLVSTGSEDVFIASDNFYTYDLRSPTPIGDKIKDRLIDQMDPNYTGIAHALVCEEASEIQFYYCTAGESTPNRAIVWNYDLNAFTAEWEMRASCSGYATYVTTDTWNTISGTWNTRRGAWDSSVFQSSRPLNMIGLGANLYILDTSVDSDNGTDYIMQWHTKQIVSADETKFVSMYRVIIGYYCSSPTTLYVALSPDGGTSWVDERTVVLTSTEENKFQYAKADFLASYNSVSVRIKCIEGGNYKIVNIKLEAIPSGEI